MRQPTPISALLRWHREALAGRRPAIHENDPHVGWFKVRMVRGGPFVPARIWIEREICPETGELASDEQMICEVDGFRRDLQREWVWLAKTPISKAEYDSLLAMRAQRPDMAATHAPLDMTETIIRP
jgi:hypothetical protein